MGREDWDKSIGRTDETIPLAPKRSVVEVSPLLHGIRRGDGVVALGSCFAQYMAQRMQQEGFDCTVNPLGTLFNPYSIARTVEAALEAETVTFPTFQTEGEWRCWWANTRVKAPTKGELEHLLCKRYVALRQALMRAKHLLITLGTNVCYGLREYRVPTLDGSPQGLANVPEQGFHPQHRSLLHDSSAPLIVTNCQRQPDRLFYEHRASVEETVEVMARMVERLQEVNPQLQIILTVSPYRYHKYGYHGSQLSKAVLLLAEEQLISRFPTTCTYFPAYEILLDELRDYRYYAPDGHHPGEEAVEVIWQRFVGLFDTSDQPTSM